MNLIDILAIDESRVASKFSITAPSVDPVIQQDETLPVGIAYVSAQFQSTGKDIDCDIYAINAKRQINLSGRRVNAALRVLQWAQAGTWTIKEFQFLRMELCYNSAKLIGVKPGIQGLFLQGLDKFFAFFVNSLEDQEAVKDGYRFYSDGIRAILGRKSGSSELSLLNWATPCESDELERRQYSTAIGFYLASKYIDKYGKDVGPISEMLLSKKYALKDFAQFDPFHRFLKISQQLE